MLPTILGFITALFPLTIMIAIGFIGVVIMGPQWDRKITLPNKSLCKALDKKMIYYDEDIRYLIIYINAIIPLMVLYNGLLVIQALFDNNVIEFFLLMGILAAQIINLVLIRGIDRIGFYINIVSIITAGAIVPIINFPGSFIPVIDYILCGVYIIPHVVYFARRSDLFFKTVKELRQEYEQ